MIMFILSLSWQFWKWAAIVNFILGNLVFIHLMRATEMHRKDNWKLEKKAISTCRRDVKRWNLVTMYLCSVTIALPRFLLFWTIFAGCFLYLK